MTSLFFLDKQHSVAQVTSDGTLEPMRRRPRGRRAIATDLAIGLVLVALALVLRLHAIERAYDLFIDEVTYGRLITGLASGRGLLLNGEPFTLHPPALFALYAGVAKALHLSGNLESQILALRAVSATLGAATVGTVWAIGRTLGLGKVAALGAAALVAVDPLEISFDSRVMLEAGAQLFAALAILGMAVLATRELTGRRYWLTVTATGLATGLTASSKETFAMVLVVVLVAMAVLQRPLSRRTSLRLVAVGAGVYAASVLAVVVPYGFDAWWSMRIDGVLRLLGLKQITGFNASTTQVTLASRIVANLGEFAVTYLVLAFGALSTVMLLRRARSRFRQHGEEPTALLLLVSLWSLSGCLYLSYATVFGSLEEQMYYIILVPCALASLTWLSTWPKRIDHPLAGLAVAALVLAPLLFNANVWRTVHGHRSDLYAQFLTWKRQHIPAGSRIAVTEGTAQFLITSADLGQWSTVTQVKAHHVDYVLVQTRLVEQGYELARPQFLARLNRQATPVFRSTTDEGGRLVLYDVRPLSGGSH